MINWFALLCWCTGDNLNMIDVKMQHDYTTGSVKCGICGGTDRKSGTI